MPKKILLLLILAVSPLISRSRPLMNAAEIELALRKMQVLGSVLYLAAHPDDENNAVLAYFSKERLLRTAYLSLTRGSGGQNLLGSEKGPYLGVLRTQELLAARRIDGAGQFFTRALDFGYSKSPRETLEIWGRDSVLSDIVWVIRKFRPDVIITRFTPEKGGHGHHRASAILALEAFRAAGDSSRFTDQLRYVEPWQPRRILWNAWRWGGYLDSVDVSRLPSIDVGRFNPLLGRSYTEIAARSRSMHKSQGFGASARYGSYLEYFELLDGEPAGTGLFGDIDLTWSRVAGGEKVQQLLQEAVRKYEPAHPAGILPVLLKAWSEMQKLPPGYWKKVKSAELLEVIRSCAGLRITAIAGDFTVIPGARLPVKITVLNRSDFSWRLLSVSLPFSDRDSLWRENLPDNLPLERPAVVSVPSSAPYSQPYWLRRNPGSGLFRVRGQQAIGRAESPPPLECTVRLRAGESVLAFTVPVLFRRTDAVAGEQYRPVEIVPPLTAAFAEEVFLFPDSASRTVGVRLRSFVAEVSGKIRLQAPAGWQIEPAFRSFSFMEKGEERTVFFRISPPANPASAFLNVRLEIPGAIAGHEPVTIDYPHIPVQMLFPETRAHLVRLDLQVRGRRIGYIMGSGDELPGYLEQIGYEVTRLTEPEVGKENLAKFDAVITGIRAYNTRGWLKNRNGRLLDYVRQGGTLVVQYNTTRGLKTDSIGPYPFQISHDRVTDETAAVRFPYPDHPLLNAPNKMTAADFDGWVQERGLYFAGEWDEHYLPLISSADPGESPKEGGLLYARYGRGTFIYTGLAFFRQLPAGVPGACRLFVNLISAGGKNEN